MKLVSKNYNFDRKFQFVAKHYADSDLYINSTGYAVLIDFDTRKPIRVFIPNKNGYIFVKGEKINFKRLVFKITYPQIELKNKVVVSLGKTFNVLSLVAVEKNQFRNLKKYQCTVYKNQNTGQIYYQWENRT